MYPGKVVFAVPHNKPSPSSEVSLRTFEGKWPKGVSFNYSVSSPNSNAMASSARTEFDGNLVERIAISFRSDLKRCNTRVGNINQSAACWENKTNCCWKVLVHQFRIIVRHSPTWFVFADISECYCPPIPSLSSQLIHLFQMIFAVDIVRIAIAGEAESSKSESQSFLAYFIMNCKLESSSAICGFLRSVEKTIKNSYLFIIKILFYSGLKSRSWIN